MAYIILLARSHNEAVSCSMWFVLGKTPYIALYGLDVSPFGVAHFYSVQGMLNVLEGMGHRSLYNFAISAVNHPIVRMLLEVMDMWE